MSSGTSYPEGDMNEGDGGMSYNPFSFNENSSDVKADRNKNSFTLGGVKKPKFKPVANKASSARRIGTSSAPTMDVPLVNTSAPKPSGSEESNVPTVPTIPVKQQPKVKNEADATKPKRADRKQDKPRGSRNQPRFLVSGESMFFATNSIHRQNTNAMDNAFLLSQQIGTKREIRRDDDAMELDEETNDDRYLSTANNGPIRFPYVKEDELHDRGALGWDEDDELVSALELLQGVKDGELLLFALPSFLPIYAQNREFGLDEESFVRTTDPKPQDYVQNELMQLPVGKIGKMRVHESGRISLDINGYVVDMNVSIPLRYQQQVATIDSQQVNMLGEVTHRLVLTPNMQNYH